MIKLINLYVNSLNDMENISKPIYLAFNIKQSYIFRWNISIYYLLNKNVHVSSLTFSIIDICTFVHLYRGIVIYKMPISNPTVYTMNLNLDT